MMTESLNSLMNSMVSRLDFILPDELTDLPEEKSWHFIQVYMRLDPVLAQLFKQYKDAKNHLGKLLLDRGSEDPMTEVAWDMHDSLRGAVETRLIELQSDDLIQKQAEALMEDHTSQLLTERLKNAKPDSQSESFEKMIAFMVWAGLVLKTAKSVRDVRRDFGHAA